MRILGLWIVCVLAGCLDVEQYMEVRVQGEVQSIAQGPIELWLMHDVYGEGALQTRYTMIATQQLEGPGPLDWTVLVPLGSGSGLTIYAWQDNNGDGTHCYPGTGTEHEATVLLSESVSFELTAQVALEPGCHGPK